MSKNKTKRDMGLDMTRGIAVLVMILAHSIVFFNSAQHPVLRLIGEFGDAVAFISFLFISGAVSYLVYIDIPDKRWLLKRHNLLKRALSLLFVYFVIGLVANYGEWRSLNQLLIPRRFMELLTFIDVAPYSEFLIPFIFYSVVIFLFRVHVKSILRDRVTFLLFCVSTYILGALFFTIFSYLPLGYYTSFLFGFADWYRFPLIQYSVVFLLGMFFSAGMKNLNAKERLIGSAIVISIISIVFVIGRIILLDEGFESEVMQVMLGFYRWPPSIPFLVIGIIFVLFGYTFCQSQIIMHAKITLQISRLLQALGSNAFLYYFIHVVLLYLYKYTINTTIYNPYLVIIAFIALMLLNTILIVIIKHDLTKKLVLSVAEKFTTVFDNISLQTKMVMTTIVIFFLFVFGFYTVATTSIAKQVWQAKYDVTLMNLLLGEDEVGWWNNDYNFRREILVSNTELFHPLEAGAFIEFTFDHSNLVSMQKSLASGDDLVVVYTTEDYNKKLDTQVLQSDTAQTVVRFRTIKPIQPYSSETYYLYYGSQNPEESGVEYIDQSDGYKVELGMEQAK